MHGLTYENRTCEVLRYCGSSIKGEQFAHFLFGDLGQLRFRSRDTDPKKEECSHFEGKAEVEHTVIVLALDPLEDELSR